MPQRPRHLLDLTCLLFTFCSLPNLASRVAAVLGRQCLSAYVISMATRASDVLAVELLQREARFMVGA